MVAASLSRKRLQGKHSSSTQSLWGEKRCGVCGREEHLPIACSASLSTLSLTLEQGCLKSLEATRWAQTLDSRALGLASSVGEQISPGGGSLHSL